jgi:transposase-like protein
MATKRKKYTREFKLEAVRLAEESELCQVLKYVYKKQANAASDLPHSCRLGAVSDN